MTPSGIEPMTFKLVQQCLNQMRHCVAQKQKITMFGNMMELPLFLV
jgi:hypothetical protein